MCSINFTGSAGAMEPLGTLELFQRSVSHKLRYKYMISDGDSKTHSFLISESVYGSEPENQVQKLDCIGHVQKRLGTALRNLKTHTRDRSLQTGKPLVVLDDSQIHS